MAIRIESFADALVDQDVGAFTGVPCSYLKSFVSYTAASGRLPYTVAASEGEAVGIAAGSWLAGRLPMVLVQNSGLGNCVNPLTSLASTFRIPLLLMVSHRARDGKDAPQHLLMGRITYALLEAMEIPHHTLPDDDRGGAETLARAAAQARETSGPVAVVVPKGTFEAYRDEGARADKAPRPAAVEPAGTSSGPLPARYDALHAVDGALAPGDLVVATTGMTSRELFAVRDRPGNFYMMGSMGCAPAVALGVARIRPDRRIVVLDGDGAFLMKMGTAATVGHYAPPGLLHLLLDNGTYETTGSQPTVSSTTSFEGVAAAAGYRRSLVLGSTSDLADLVSGFTVGDGPVFATLRIRDGHLDGVGRVGRTPEQIRDDFREAVRDELLVP